MIDERLREHMERVRNSAIELLRGSGVTLTVDSINTRWDNGFLFRVDDDGEVPLAPTIHIEKPAVLKMWLVERDGKYRLERVVDGIVSVVFYYVRDGKVERISRPTTDDESEVCDAY